MNVGTLRNAITLLVILLVIVGSMLVFSATGSMVLFKSHILKAAVAVGAFVLGIKIPYRYYKKVSKYLMLGIVLALLLTLFIGVEKNGATRWIDLGFLTVQTSEIAKLVLIMHLALMIEKKGDKIKDFKQGFRYALFWIGLICFLVIIQPNVSTTIIIAVTAFTLLFVGGASIKHLAVTLGGGFAAVLASVFLFFPHAVARITKFLTSTTDQVKQAKIALGSGGILGVGLGNSRQADAFVPEPYGDFIFSILGEELGFAGTLAVLSFYLAFFVIGIIIAKKAEDKFGQLLGFGISFMIVFSAFTNAAVVTGLLPTTGITLPFISFGGTSLIVFAASTGILLNIAGSAMKKTENLPQAGFENLQ